MRMGFWCAVLIGMFSLSSVRAQEIALESFSGIGARAMGMGGAYVSLSDDFSGLFWNPAGLARVQRGEITWGAMRNGFKNDTKFFNSPDQYELIRTRIGTAGLVYPVPVYRGSLVIAGGYGRNRSFDSGLAISGYDTGIDYEKSGFSEDRGALGAWTFGMAVDLAPNLSLGIAAFRWDGRNRFAQELTQDDVRDAHVDTVQLYQRFEATEDYSAWSAIGGMQYRHPNGLRLGLTATLSTALQVRSQLVDEYEDVFDDRTDRFPEDHYGDAYEISQPMIFAIGVGWVRENVALSGDVHIGDLQEVTYTRFPRAVAPNVDDFRRQYRNAMRLHVGAEYVIEGLPLALRVGYYRDPVRYIGGGTVPTIQILSDRDAWTFGIGGELERTLQLDVAVVIGGYRVREGRREDHVRTMRIFASAGFGFDVPQID